MSAAQRLVECTCGRLEKLARDPRVRVRRNEQGTGFIWAVTDAQDVKIVACSFCGGYEVARFEGVRSAKDFLAAIRKAPERPGAPCICGTMAELARNPDTRVSYDADLDEYAITGIGLLYYCLVCGGRMPKSRRGDLFLPPDPREEEEFFQATEGLRTIEDVIAKLGPPDAQYGPYRVPDLDTEIYGAKDIVRGWRYTTRWPSLNVSIQEDEHGRLTFSYGGKTRRKKD
jgi:hypothetical protein